MALFGMTPFQWAVIIAMATNVLWITIILLIKFKSHAFTELGAWLHGKALILLDTGNKYHLIAVEDESISGAMKGPIGTFIKTPYSVKTLSGTGCSLAVAVSKNAFLVTPDIGLLGQLAYETKKDIVRKFKNTPQYDDKGNIIGISSEELPNLQKEAEKDPQKLLEVQGLTELERANKKVAIQGITVNFDQVTHFFKQLSPSSVDAKIELVIANRLAKERHALSFQNVMLIVMLMLGAAIAFVIIKGGSINPAGLAAAVKQAIAGNATKVAGNATIINA